MKPLPVPQEALTDARAVEVVRVWIANGEQHVSLNIGPWPDPAAWGLLLVDLANHIASAYAEARGLKSAKVLERIHEAFEAEIGLPTDALSRDDA